MEGEADLIWVYILGGAIVGNILLCAICVYCRYRVLRKAVEQELKDRAEGKIVKSWGIRTGNIEV